MRLALLLCLFLAQTAYANNHKVAIIIDDIGYRAQDRQTLSLPGQFTLSVLPHTPYGKILADKAHAQNRDVMLHIPMEALSGMTTGPGAITTGMNSKQINASLARALAEIPYAVGINNHMGSLLTQKEQPLRTTMAFLRQQGLLFIDSRTTNATVAEKIATESGVPSAHRNIFLDHEQTEAFLEQQFQALIQRAKRHPHSIAIAHPYPITLTFLQDAQQRLAAHGIELVPITDLFSEPSPSALDLASLE